MWFLTVDGTQLIQIQRDRFAFNWRKLDTDRQYPHYDQVRDDFVRQLEKFLGFLREEGLEDPNPDQVELTYVNHIPAAIQLQSRFLTRDNSPVYHLQLIARGAPTAEQPGLPGVLAFLDQGHVWIVRTFTDITTKEMHVEWKRRR